MDISLVPTSEGELPARFSSLGYHSFPALARALQEFSEVHEWAFRSLGKAAVLVSGGVEWSHNPPKQLVLVLAPATTARAREHNPACTFRLSSYSFTTLSQTNTYGPFQVTIDGGAHHEQMRRLLVEMWRRHPDYLGVLPMTFLVDGLSTRFARFIPQLRPAQLPSPTPLVVDDSGKKAVLEDIIRLCSGSINAGIPIRPQEGSGPEGMVLALPGQYVRGQSGSWSWTTLFSCWEDYRRGVHLQLDELFDTLTLRNVPGDTIAAFNLL